MKTLADNFKTSLISQFEESFNDDVYYICAHKSTPWDNELSAPDIVDSESTHYRLFRDLVFGKRVIADDFVYAVRRIEWETGTVYDQYDDTVSLETKNYFVVSEESDEYHVFKCLYNNKGEPSTVQPLKSETGATDVLYETSDGYQWKYMYSINETQWNKFATSEFIPVIPNSNVSSNAVNGSIDVIDVIDGSREYNSYANGTIQETKIAGNNQLFSIISEDFTLSSNTDFYKNCSLYIRSGAGSGQLKNISEYIVTGSEKRVLLDSGFDVDVDQTSVFEITPRVTISGDGSGAEAIAIVDPLSSNSISRIEMINRGSGYTYANVAISGNTGSLDATQAEARAIIPPVGGHGFDPKYELNSIQFCISAEFDGSETDTIPVENDYRQVSIIQSPRFANVEIELDSSSTSFVDGEIVTQDETNASGEVSNRDGTTLRLRNISGFLETGLEITGANSSYSANVVSIDRGFDTFDQRRIYQGEIIYSGTDGQGLSEDQLLSQASSLSTGFVHNSYTSGNTVIVEIIGNVGEFLISDDATSTINKLIGEGNRCEVVLTGEDKSRNKLSNNVGRFIYIENFLAVERSADQKEQIKVVVKI